jgi:hypothetical protein
VVGEVVEVEVEEVVACTALAVQDSDCHTSGFAPETGAAMAG